MAVEILNAVIHGVKKESNTHISEAKYKVGCFNTTDPLLIQFTDELLKAYSEEANTWADIKEATHNVFHQNLIKWFKTDTLIEDQIEFYDFSKIIVDEIVLKIKGKYKATGGYMLLIHYKSNSVNYLLVVMLKLETRFGIDENDLNFFETESFTMKNFHEAVRMNLDTWLARSAGLGIDEDGTPEKFFSFVKKRGADEDITRYFRDALGCDNFAESTANTSKLIRALDAFVDQKVFATEALKFEYRESKRDVLHTYLSSKVKEKEPVKLSVVTALISPTDNEDDENEFLTFIKSNEKFKIDEIFKPHKGKTKDLERVSGKINGGSISFPIGQIEQSVFYNPETRELRINEIPDDLHRKILDAKGLK